MSPTIDFSRREFLKTASAAGAGIVIGFHLSGCASDAPPGPVDTAKANAWLHINSDDSIRVIVDRSEMGQGVTTSLPMLVAEELEADMSKITIEFAPAHAMYNNQLFGMQATGGSSSVRAAWTPLRQAGADGRALLIAAAAKEWNVSAAECHAEKGFVIHGPSNKRARFGALVATAKTIEAPQKTPLKDPKDWKVIGTRALRIDVPVKVDGSAQFGMDVRVPGMLVALIARCPVPGGKVVKFDDAKAKAVKGVKHVVQVSSGVAVVADGYWPAHKGRAALDVTWNEGATAAVSDASIARMFATKAAGNGVTARRDGDAARAIAAAATKLDATYDAPFLAHATMEPMNCTAHVRADGVDIWAPTQFQGGAQGLGAQIGGVAPDTVKVHTTYLGGGFGRRFEMDFIQEALEVSKAVNAPAKVVWSREDDMRHGQYRPASHHVLRAGLDASGQPLGWSHHVIAPSIMARVFPQTVQNGLDAEAVEGAMGVPYAIPNVRVGYSMADTGIPVGFWRSVNNSYNGWVVESFIDELAHAAKQDPYQYRRALLAKAPRHLAALELAATKAGWGSPLPAGRGRGIAVCKSFESFVAEVAEVSVDAQGVPHVHRVVCAIECGPVVNPSIVEAQLRSAVVFGLTAALYGEINIDKGRVTQGNFDSYRMVRMVDMPTIEAYIVPSTEAQGGVGEPGTPPIAPAVCNAIFAATGKRVRRLPIGRVV